MKPRQPSGTLPEKVPTPAVNGMGSLEDERGKSLCSGLFCIKIYLFHLKEVFYFP